jgi:hypothetical protein
MDLGKLEKTGESEKARTQIPPSEAFSAQPMRGKEISAFLGEIEVEQGFRPQEKADQWLFPAVHSS